MKQNLYRKYRPQSFSELLGQDHIVRTLQAAVSQGRISHAYLFSGPRGTGKTSAARLLAKILNCRTPVTVQPGMKDACRTCDICRRIEELNFMDIIEIDAASNNSVDDIRDMREKVKYSPAEGQYKIYIIDEVHMLSGAAFNAFLKTLEEPPARVIFVLATTDPQKLPSTIISRCQCFDFHSISLKVLVERLTEVVRRERELDPQMFPEVPAEVLHVIAESVDGGFRDALSLLDQITSAYPGGSVTMDSVLEMTRRVGFKTMKALTDRLFQKDCSGLLNALNDLFYRGHEVASLGRDLLEYLRRALFFKIDEKGNRLFQIPQEQANELLEQVKGIPLEFLLAVVSRLERVLTQLKNSVHPRLLFEIELSRIAQREISLGLEGVERRLTQMEETLKTPARVVRTTQLFSQSAVPGIAPIPPSPVIRPVAHAETVASPRPAGKPVSSDDPGERFKQFRQMISQKNKVMAAYYHNARIESCRDGVITVMLESEFASRQANDPKYMELAKPFISALYGPNFKLEVKGPSKSGENKPALNAVERPSNIKENIVKIDQEERRKMLEKPPVAEAIEVFGGEISHIEKT